MDRGQSQEQESRISRDYTEDRAIAFGSQGVSTGGGSRGRRDNLHSDDKRRESGQLQQRQASHFKNWQIRLEHERLFNTLQRASGRTRKKDRTAATTDRAIDRSQSSIERTEQLITAKNRSIGEREQATSDHERQANQSIEMSQEKTRTVSRGFDMEL